jgi:hypothetical protein
MKFSQIKTVKEFCSELFSTPCWRDVLQNILDDENDFDIENVRFIKADEIDSVLGSELSNDAYVLGCFNASFIAQVTGWPLALIEAAQKGEAFESLGQAIINEGYCEGMAEAYASADGYGHHFNSYNGESEEFEINGVNYYVFDNH